MPENPDADTFSKAYLGDSVYVAVENGMLKLTTENGWPDDPRNTIYLELFVYRELVRYVAALERHAR